MSISVALSNKTKSHIAHTKTMIRTRITQITLLLISLPFFNLAIAANIQDLKSKIDDKSKELQSINQQIIDNQKYIEQLQKYGKTLSGEIKKTDANIKQIGLGIKASEISIEKLNFEIDTISDDINGIQNQIVDKKEAVKKIIGLIRENDEQSLIVIFLKKQSLAQAFSEFQNFADVNKSLAQQIDDLKNLKDDVSQKLEITENKKHEVEAENINLKNKKSISESLKKDKENLLLSTKNKESAYKEKLDDLEKLQKDVADEIEKMEAELRTKIDPSLLPTKRPGVLIMPLEGKISQNYGITSFSKNYRGKWHNGIDIAAPIGTPIYAADKGKVIMAGDQDKYCASGAYGKYIVIKHQNNLATLYAHMSLYAVDLNQEIERGQLIGYVGKTGWATGPHLHFTVFDANTFSVKQSRLCGSMPIGGDINPLDYL